MTQQAGKSASKRGRPWRLSLWILVGVALASLLGLGIVWVQRFNALRQAFMTPGMAAAQYADGDTVGDLGGVPVTIPRHFANFVEYESDPRWSEGRTTSRGPVTHASKLVSFGFYVRFPDMAGESTPELRTEKRTRDIGTSMWLNVGITTGKLFPGTGFMDRHLSHLNDSRLVKYEQLADSWADLTVFEPIGNEPKTQQPWREHRDGDRIFVHRNEFGAVDTYVRCLNGPFDSTPCQQEFSLEPQMKALVYVSYRRGLLPQWRQIQAAVSKLIWSFEVPHTDDLQRSPR